MKVFAEHKLYSVMSGKNPLEPHFPDTFPKSSALCPSLGQPSHQDHLCPCLGSPEPFICQVQMAKITAGLQQPGGKTST